jgi:membrane protein DedA with SNARE-associated domain
VFFEPAILLLDALRGGTQGYVAWFLALFGSGVGVPLSQDALLLALAAATRLGGLRPLPAMALAWLAVVGGDLLTFWTGRYFGAKWIRRPWAARFVPPESLPALEEVARRWASLAAFITRFLPGQRITLFFIAGTLRMPYARMLAFDGLAAAIQVPLLFYGVRALGWQWERWRGPIDNVDNLLTIALVIVLVSAWQKGQRAHPHKAKSPAEK